MTNNRNRLIIIIAIFIMMVVAMILLSYFSNKMLVGTRGYISGELYWSKAQSNAVICLIKFTTTQEESYHEQFYDELTVIKGDRAARITLSSNSPDYQVAYDGFLQGNIHPDEIDDMIWLFKHFQEFSFMRDAISYWEQADDLIDELIEVGLEIQQHIDSNQLTEEKIYDYLSRLYALDMKLQDLEVKFSENIVSAAVTTNKISFWLTLAIMISIITVGGIFTVSYYWQVNTLYEELKHAEFKFQNVLDNSRDIIYQMNTDGTRFDYMSPSITEITGFPADDFLREGPAFIEKHIHPDDKKYFQYGIKNITISSEISQIVEDFEFRMANSDGEYLWFSACNAPIRNTDGQIVAIVGNVRDITQKKKNIASINKSLKEKETLLAEIHHRVKNNLAIISSLIELQKDDQFTSTELALKEIQSRISSIALVHEKLYSSDTFSEIQLIDYIEDLTTVISKTYRSSNKRIHTKLDLTPVTLDIAQAVPVGLIYNEIINNAYKHGFEGLNKGQITVTLTLKNNQATLTVKDNGVGLPDDFNVDKIDSLGITLIKTLSQQLKGELIISSTPETSFQVTFPVV